MDKKLKTKWVRTRGGSVSASTERGANAKSEHDHARSECDWRADGKTRQSRCLRPSTHRSPTVARCELHGGHLDYTERWTGSAWELYEQLR